MEKREYSVLVADESRECRDAFRGALEPEGYSVAAAASGRDAIRIIYSEPIDLVVLDLRLPDYPGVQIYHAIKEIRDTFLPCIFTAIQATTRSFCDAMNENAITILPKPVDRSRLLHAVDWSVDRYYAGRERRRGERRWSRLR